MGLWAVSTRDDGIAGGRTREAIPPLDGALSSRHRPSTLDVFIPFLIVLMKEVQIDIYSLGTDE
jgi:hypothetical protein